VKPIYVFGSKTKPTCEEETTDSFVTSAVNLCLMLKDDFDVTVAGLPGSGKGRLGDPNEGTLGVKAMTWDNAPAKLRAEPDTAVVCVTGPDHLADALALPQTVCEPTRGYDLPVFTGHVAFPSWAWFHYHVGRYGPPRDWHRWCVLPHAIVPERFDYSEDKQDYVLFLGRLTQGKGLDVAIEACRIAGKRLVAAGTHCGVESDALIDKGRETLGSGFEYVGFADYHTRRRFLADAGMLIYPAEGLEPFGYTVLEANVSGTPAIVPDKGAFTETVKNGVNGFRCRDAAQMADALAQIDTIPPPHCRKWARENFGVAAVKETACGFLGRIAA
jgi:glycosyltransferase involved in cell wall biosynthesis